MKMKEKPHERTLLLLDEGAFFCFTFPWGSLRRLAVGLLEGGPSITMRYKAKREKKGFLQCSVLVYYHRVLLDKSPIINLYIVVSQSTVQ